jgi:hypothetical protein
MSVTSAALRSEWPFQSGILRRTPNLHYSQKYLSAEFPCGATPADVALGDLPSHQQKAPVAARKLLVSSIKGVKGNTFLRWPDFFMPSSPPRLSRIVVALRCVISGRCSISVALLVFLCQWFSSFLRDEASPFGDPLNPQSNRDLALNGVSSSCVVSVHVPVSVSGCDAYPDR